MKSVHTKVILYLLLLVGALYTPAFLNMRDLATFQTSRGEKETLPVYGSDSGGFVSLANNFLQTGQFRHPDSLAETFRTPGYPALLAVWKEVFGSYTFFPVLQIILVYLTALMIYHLGYLLFRPLVGVLAATLFVLDPNILFHSLVILSEIPHVFLMVLGTYLLFLPRERFSIPPECVSGILFGLAVLVKPVSLYVPAIFVLYLLVSRWKSKQVAQNNHRAWRSAFVFFLVYVAVLMPWSIRNYHVSGVWGISSVSSFNLFFYTVPEFLSFKDHITPDEGRMRLSRELALPDAPLSDLKYAPALQKVALRYIAENPLQFAGFYAVKTIPFFFSSSLDNLFTVYNDVRRATIFHPSTANLTNFLLKGDVKSVLLDFKAHPAIFAEQILLGFLILFALLALILRKTQRAELILLFFVVAYFAAVTGPVAYARFRVPASPFLFILAAVGFSASIELLWPPKKEKNPRSFPLSFPSTTSRAHFPNSSRVSLSPNSQKG